MALSDNAMALGLNSAPQVMDLSTERLALSIIRVGAHSIVDDAAAVLGTLHLFRFWLGRPRVVALYYVGATASVSPGRRSSRRGCGRR